MPLSTAAGLQFRSVLDITPWMFRESRVVRRADPVQKTFPTLDAGLAAAVERVGAVNPALAGLLRSAPVIITDFEPAGAGAQTLQNTNRGIRFVMIQTWLDAPPSEARGSVPANYSAGNPVEAVTLIYLHELGHLIDRSKGMTFSKRMLGGIVPSRVPSRSLTFLGIDERLAELETDLSPYAATSTEEAWAEATSLFFTGTPMPERFSWVGEALRGYAHTADLSGRLPDSQRPRQHGGASQAPDGRAAQPRRE